MKTLKKSLAVYSLTILSLQIISCTKSGINQEDPSQNATPNQVGDFVDLDISKISNNFLQETINKIKKGDKSAVNAQDEYGNSPMHIAVWNCAHDIDHFEKTLKFLKDNGADMNILDKYKNTILLTYTKLQNGLEGIKMLLKLGVDPNKQDNNGNTALMLTGNNHISGKTSMILLKKTDFSHKNNQGETIFTILIKTLCCYGQRSAFKQLLDEAKGQLAGKATKLEALNLLAPEKYFKGSISAGTFATTQEAHDLLKNTAWKNQNIIDLLNKIANNIGCSNIEKVKNELVDFIKSCKD